MQTIEITEPGRFFRLDGVEGFDYPWEGVHFISQYGFHVEAGDGMVWSGGTFPLIVDYQGEPAGETGMFLYDATTTLERVTGLGGGMELNFRIGTWSRLIVSSDTFQGEDTSNVNIELMRPWFEGDFPPETGAGVLEYTALEDQLGTATPLRLTYLGWGTSIEASLQHADGSKTPADRIALEDGMLRAYVGDVEIASFDVSGTDIETDEITLENGGRIVFACFAKGTRIATPDGWVPVEALKPDDQVITASGRTQKIKWIGYRRLRFRYIARADLHKAYPIHIRAHALGENIPQADLRVSPAHQLQVEGYLIPAGLLVNGVNITQDTSLDEIEYYHIELPRYDMVLAEGVAAESYFDAGNREMFQNHATYDASGDKPAGPVWNFRQRRGYKVLKEGEELDRIRQKILDHATAMPPSAG